ncbi:crossover junction endodeoxyribonuclease RuvC [Porphyromonas miyakawae]|uniref:Crossover junction endodeoxyribonuclease RuvC n=1 Tax=Porphyromonas miyakawae TaxID=3137470 RepID=A0ABQ0E1D0_9PORP
MAAERIILGVDPGTVIMGYGLLKINGAKPNFMAMGIIELGKLTDPYLRLKRIYDRITGIIEEFLPDEMAIEAPFFGKNVQSMLKLGRAQGVAIAAALARDLPITEYAPRRIKQSITGSGDASKEQVAEMLQRLLHIPQDSMLPALDATDGLAAALCHYYQTSNPLASGNRVLRNWSDFVKNNPNRIRDPYKKR